MRQCVEMLVPDLDEESFRLVRKQPEGDGINLKELLLDFLNDFSPGVHIAVACGAEETWTVNDFAKILVEYRPESLVNQQVVPFDNEFPLREVIVYCICAAVIKKNDGRSGGGVEFFLDNVSKVLKSISERVDAQGGGDEDVKAAKDAIRRASEEIAELAARVSVRMRSKSRMEEIQADLSNDNVKNGFPIVKIVVFLPEDAFGGFAEEEYYFFSQIERVLHFTEFTPEMIKALMDQIRELEEQKKELEENNQLQVKDLEARIRTLEAQIRTLEGQIGELRAQNETQSEEQEHHNPVAEGISESQHRGEIRVDLGGSIYIAGDISELQFLANYLVQERMNEKEKLLSDVDKYFITRQYVKYTPKDGEEMSEVEKNADATVSISTETAAEKEDAVENTINMDDQEQCVKKTIDKDTLARAKGLWEKQKGDRMKGVDSIERVGL